MTNADRSDRRAMQLALAAFLFWMAFRLALPDPMIVDTPAMSGMRFQPEWAWTLECLFGGCVGIFSVITSCQRCEFVATATLMSAHISLSWFLVKGGASLLPGALVIFVGLCIWVLSRSWKEVR